MNNCMKLLIIVWVLIVPAFTSLNAQTVVGLPLRTYANNGATTLTPAIVVATVDFTPADVSFTLDGAVVDWLSAKGTDLGGGQYKVELFVPAGKCVPRPTTATDCGTTCGTAIPDYGTSTVRKCYAIALTAFGAVSNHTLCVYGDAPLSISPDAQHFDVGAGSVTEKIWNANRNGNIKWSLTPTTGTLTMVAGTESMQAVKLSYAPMGPETGMYTLKLAGNNPNLSDNDACDVSPTKIINVKASDQTTPGQKVDLVLVVDVSGSMGDKGACTPGTGTQYNPADFASKMGFVKSNLKGIFQKIVEVAPPAGSRIGVVTFADNAEEKLIGGNFFNDISSGTTATGIDNIINGLTPTTSTNMGAGLSAAISRLSGSGSRKQIVLITNGMQNGNQLVRRSGSTSYIDKNNNAQMDGGEAIPADIQIFTIAIFQPSNDYLSLLRALSNNGSRFNDVCELSEAVDQAFAKTYENNSPKFVGSRRGNFSGGAATINYNLTENGFDKIIVSLSSTQNTNITYRFEKNVSGSWKDITSGGRLKQVAPGYTTFAINGLPKMVNGDNITPQGQYRLVATSTKANADYYSSAIVDDRGLHEATFVESKTIRAGKSIVLSTRLRNNNNPVHQANASVLAVVHRPVLSFEKLMAQQDVPSDKVITYPLNRESKQPSLFKRFGLKPADGTTFETNLPLIEQKYQVLVYEKDLLGKLVWATDTVPLPEVSNGIYKATYSNTKISGMYRVEYLINGVVPVTGNFFRTSSISTPVLFSTPDRPASNFYLFDENGHYFLSLRPVDIYGNYLGMGKADQVNITMSTGYSNQVIDYLDGRYVIPVNVFDNQNPWVVITIDGMEFYQGPLFNIPQKRFFVGLQAGYTSPMGNFNNAADPGFMGGLKLGYRFNRKWGILAEGGYFSFKKAAPASGNTSIIGGGAGVFFIPTSLPIAGGLAVQLEGTVGYYKPKDIDGNWGLRGGIDLSKYFKTWFSMSLNGSYYRIYTKPDEIDFLGLSLIAKFHF